MPARPTILVQHLQRLSLSAKVVATPDPELIRRFSQSHDEAAFACLLQRHGPTVWGVCQRVLGHDADAEDAFQATFLLLARQAGKLHKPETVSAWLFGVARRISCKARSRRNRDIKRNSAPLKEPDASPLDSLSASETLAILDEELTRLPEEYRLPIILCCLEGKSREEAAEQLGWSSGSVKGRLERGRELLASRLTKRGLTLTAAFGSLLIWNSGAQAAAPFASALATALNISETPANVSALASKVVPAGFSSWKWALVTCALFGGVGTWAVLSSKSSDNLLSAVQPPRQGLIINPAPAEVMPQPREVLPEMQPVPPARVETLIADVVSFSDGILVLQPRQYTGDQKENTPKLPQRRLTVGDDTPVMLDMKRAPLAALRKNLRISIEIESDSNKVRNITILNPRKSERPLGEARPG